MPKLEKFAKRRLEEHIRAWFLDARYEKVREDGAVRSQAVLIAIGIKLGRQAQRTRGGVSQSGKPLQLARGADRPAWTSLHGVEFVVSDDHADFRKQFRKACPTRFGNAVMFMFLRNALDYLPRKADDDCLQGMRWIYDRRDAQQARRDLAARLETLSFYRLPRQHHKNLKSTNRLERLREEIKRCTQTWRFSGRVSCGCDTRSRRRAATGRSMSSLHGIGEPLAVAEQMGSCGHLD